MANFNEHALEMSIMELFKDEKYTYVSGDQIHRERTEVLLTDDLKQYLYNRYAKDGITPSEVDSVILMLRNISGTIYEANKAVFKLLCDGFILNREDRTQKDLYIELIDFDTPENNIFKAVNQFEIEGVNNQLRIPDGIVFVNGIPVVVLEFKSAVQENTTIMDAYKQLTIRYRRDIPEIFKYNALMLFSCQIRKSRYFKDFFLRRLTSLRKSIRLWVWNLQTDSKRLLMSIITDVVMKRMPTKSLMMLRSSLHSCCLN